MYGGGLRNPFMIFTYVSSTGLEKSFYSNHVEIQILFLIRHLKNTDFAFWVTKAQI